MNARRDQPLTVEPMLPSGGGCPPHNRTRECATLARASYALRLSTYWSARTEGGAQTVGRYQEGQRS